MRTLTWHYGGLLHAGAHDVRQRRGGATGYRLDREYYPVAVRLYCDEAPTGSPVVVDLNDDGATIFTNPPQVDKDTTGKEHKTFNEVGRVKMEARSLITMDIDSVGSSYPGTGLTVELDLEEVE